MGKHPIVKAIKKGNVDEVMEILEREPDLVNQDLKVSWGILPLSVRSILHVAAYFEQPEIVKFLVAEKGMDINKKRAGGIIPLHDAVAGNGWRTLKAAKVLLELGADPTLRDDKGHDAYAYCVRESKEVLGSIYRELLSKKALATAESQQAEEESARVKGIWTRSHSPDEIIFERDLPEQQLRFTEIFNLAAKEWTLITKNLENGQLTQPVVKPFSEIADIKVKEAETQLAALSGDKKPDFKLIVPRQ